MPTASDDLQTFNRSAFAGRTPTRTSDGWVIHQATAVHGARDLRDALLRMVLATAADQSIERTVLSGSFPRLSAARVRREVEALGRVLRPALADRLGVVGVAADGECVVPDRPETRRFAAPLLAALGGADPGRISGRSARPSRKLFAVLAALLDAWLRREPPLLARDLARRAGCSHPTVAAAIARMKGRGEIEGAPRRRVALADLPAESLREAASLDEILRRPRAFAATSGVVEPEALLRRLMRLRPDGVALGGAAAAMRRDPVIDFPRLPRVDVVQPGGDLAWIEKMDVSLRPTAPQDPSAVLVVRDPLSPAEADAREPLPLASPTDTLLDLFALGAAEAASNLARNLRGGA